MSYIPQDDFRRPPGVVLLERRILQMENLRMEDAWRLLWSELYHPLPEQCWRYSYDPNVLIERLTK